MPSPPHKPNASCVTNTPTPYHPPPSTSSLLQPRPSLTRLPSLPSSTSFSTPPLNKLPWSSDKAGGEVTGGSGPNDSRRSVRWSDSHLGKDSRRSSLFSTKKALDPQQMWARYTQTVRPPFHLYEPSLGRMAGRGGGHRKSGRRALKENDEDSKYVLKMSLPCPKHSGCSFCVYSRQLGPVRIYMSSFRTPKLHTASRGSGRLGKEASSVEVKEDPAEKPQMVLLKEPWRMSSLPSGEVIVPELPSDGPGSLHPRHVESKILSGELAKAGTLHDTGKGKNHRTILREPITSRLDPWLRNSAPPDFPAKTSSIQDYIGKPRLPRPFTLWDDDSRTRTSSELFPRVPKNTPRSLNTIPVKTNGKPPLKNTHAHGQILDKDELKGPSPFPCRDLAAPLRLLSKRPNHL